MKVRAINKRWNMAYFPMFINIEGADCLVVGGGRIALKKVRVLRDFGARIFVAAPVICDEIRLMTQETENIYIYERQTQDEDFTGMRLVVAATDSKAVNREIAGKAKKLGIPVNAVDSIEDCTFIFPSYHREKDVVAAYSTGGNSPVITQYLRDKGRQSLTEFVGDMAEFMGDIRPYVKEHTDSESVRKAIYRKIFELGMNTGRIPEDSQVEEIIKSVKNSLE